MYICLPKTIQANDVCIVSTFCHSILWQIDDYECTHIVADRRKPQTRSAQSGILLDLNLRGWPGLGFPVIRAAARTFHRNHSLCMLLLRAQWSDNALALPLLYSAAHLLQRAHRARRHG